MKNVQIVVVMAILLVLGGCSTKVVVIPDMQEIDKTRKDEYLSKINVGVEKGINSSHGVQVIKSNINAPFESNMDTWTDQAISLVTDAIRNSGGQVSPSAEKTLKLTYESHEIAYNQWTWRTACKGSLLVEYSGVKKEYPVSNNSPGTFNRACGGAILLSVTAFIDDKEFWQTLK